MAKQEKFGKICKEGMIEEILARFKKHPNFFITNYMGTSTADLESLRRNLKKASSRYFVVKNAAFRVVLQKLKLEEMAALVDGGVGVSTGGDDIITTCKTLVTFAKEHEKFKVKGAHLDGKSISADRLKELASLPPRDVLLARVVGGMQAPITGFVNVLGAVTRSFVYVVDAIRVSREKTAGSTPKEASIQN